MKAFTYLRVSGDGQIDGDGFIRQREACSRYAASAGFELAGEFRDEGVPGKTELLGRTGLTACMESCQRLGVNLILVEAADRLARDLIVCELLVRECQKAGIRIIAASGGVDLTAGDDSNPTAKLVRHILAAVSEFDRSTIVLKLKAARDRKRSREGRCEGRKPFGQTPAEMTQVSFMRRRRSEGATCTEIAQELSQRGDMPRYGAFWNPASVAKILRRGNVS